MLSGHDLFFLPTLGENFGHVIYEALSAGLPVLLSDQTPWGQVNAQGAGWCFPLDSVQKLSDQIDEVASWSIQQAQVARERAIGLAVKHSSDQLALERTKSLFGVPSPRK